MPVHEQVIDAPPTRLRGESHVRSLVTSDRTTLELPLSNTQDEKNGEKSPVPLSIENVGSVSFHDEQRLDPSFPHWFDKAKSGDFKKAKNDQWRFYAKDQTLLRYFASPLRSVMQLAVPLKYRRWVLMTVYEFVDNWGLLKLSSASNVILLTGHITRCAKICSIVSGIPEYG